MKTNNYARLDDDDDLEPAASFPARSELAVPASPARDSAAPRSGIVHKGTSPPDRFTFITVPENDGWNYPAFNFAVRELGIAVGPPTLLIATSGSGKSFLVQDLALCAAAGQRFLGTIEVKPGKVMHLDYDQGGLQTRARYLRLMRGRSLPPGAIAEDALGFGRPDWLLTSNDADAKLGELVEGRSLCIIDALRPAVDGDENDSEIRKPLNMLTKVSEKTGCCFLVIHHMGKDKSDKKGRGSSAIFDAAGTVLNLEKAGEGFDATYRLTQSKSRTGIFSGMSFKLKDEGEMVESINARERIRLERVEMPASDAAKPDAAARIRAKLKEHPGMGFTDLFKDVGGRKKTFGDELKRLVDEGVVQKNKDDRYSLTDVARAGYLDA
jgi:hypothetical protein